MEFLAGAVFLLILLVTVRDEHKQQLQKVENNSLSLKLLRLIAENINTDIPAKTVKSSKKCLNTKQKTSKKPKSLVKAVKKAN